MRPRIYVDTSVFGGCEDVEFIGHSRRLVADMTNGDYAMVISEVTLLELEKGERADALHIALATAARVDVLVSWNFKHIVNLRRIHAFNAVNLKHGYPVLEIRNPREVIGDE
jgi:predicted nucleic acid-binding protein